MNPNSRKGGLLTAFFALLLVFSLSGCQALEKKDPITRTSFQLNTVVTVTIYDSRDESLLDGCMELCAQYEQIFSRTLESSELALLNAQAKKEENAGQALPVSEDLAALLEKGLSYSRLSNGAFDITLEPVSSLWDFSSGTNLVPSASSIEAALPHIGYEKLHLSIPGSAPKTASADSSARAVTFDEAGMGLDLGAIAKGYIGDRMRDYLISQGVKSAYISLGGNVLCIGEKPDGTPFRIGIQSPFSQRNEIITYLDVRDLSIVTSGIYERCFEANGQFYHHLLDPKTGYPYENHLVSVTILSPYSVDGDGLSTCCFALGLDKGMELLNGMDGIYGIFITDDQELHYSEGFEDAFSLNSLP